MALELRLADIQPAGAVPTLGTPALAQAPAQPLNNMTGMLNSGEEILSKIVSIMQKAQEIQRIRAEAQKVGNVLPTAQPVQTAEPQVIRNTPEVVTMPAQKTETKNPFKSEEECMRFVEAFIQGLPDRSEVKVGDIVAFMDSFTGTLGKFSCSEVKLGFKINRGLVENAVKDLFKVKA